MIKKSAPCNYTICQSKWKPKRWTTSRSTSQTRRGRGNRQNQTSANWTNVRKNTMTRAHVRRYDRRTSQKVRYAHMLDGMIGARVRRYDRHSDLRVRFCAIKTDLSPAVVFLLTVPMRFKLVNIILQFIFACSILILRSHFMQYDPYPRNGKNMLYHCGLSKVFSF